MIPHRPHANLVEALCATRGIICVVGAGGKKTTLYRLAAEHGGRVGITSTVVIPPFPDTVTGVRVIAEESCLTPAVIEAARHGRTVAFAMPMVKHERLGAVAPAQITQIHTSAHFDITLVKCDGARGRLIKAPGPEEPVIPAGTTTVIPLVSARVIGKRLSERIAHRVAQITAVTGARPGDIITPMHVARLLASTDGALKNVSEASVVPVINMVDNRMLDAAAREVAEIALDLCDPIQRVVLTRMRLPEPVIEIVVR
ncbi:MAG: selenium cofactor biosynthesis protein YqeC [Gammaproteobacteria bacterium]